MLALYNLLRNTTALCSPPLPLELLLLPTLLYHSRFLIHLSVIADLQVLLENAGLDCLLRVILQGDIRLNLNP